MRRKEFCSQAFASSVQPEMEVNMIQKLAKNLWKALSNPTVRLNSDFPFSLGRSLKLYGKSLLYFLVGSLLPIGLFLGALRLIPENSVFFRDFILAENSEGLVLVILSVSTFVCGFGMQLFCIRQAVHRENRRLRDLLSLNLKSLNGSWLKAFGLGVATYLLALFAEQLVGQIYTVPSTDPTADFIKTLGGNALYLMMALAMMGPFVEEVIFRGFLYNIMAKHATSRLTSATAANLIAVLGSAAVFGLMHMNIAALPFYMVLGAVYAESYRRSGTLVVPIIAHVLNNSVIVITLLLRVA